MTLLDDSIHTRSAPADRPPLDRFDVWTDEMVDAAGIPLHDVPFVSVGGGMGSFVTVDYLRVAGGVPASDIRVLSNLSHPWQTYEHLTRVSQLPRQKRIRSDSASRPDNLWGFPSFAIQEAVARKSVKPLLQVLFEPVFADFYTPELDMVLKGIEREAHRIGYWDMLVQGEVRMVRRRAGGGYFTILENADGRTAFRSRDVHLAVGYAGLRFLPDMQAFRTKLNDFHHVVNGYEDHEHVYEVLRRRPGTVLVRGGGIVTSAVLERLITDRLKYGSQTQIVQLFRTYYDGRHGSHMWSRRPGRNGFAYQGFNYPKSAWGGQLKARMRRLEGSARAEVYDEIGGTTTAWRRHWQRNLAKARKGGWYHTVGGTIQDMRLDGDQMVARIQHAGGVNDLRVDYVIDCTGLDGDVSRHEVLKDLLQHSGATQNPLGRLDVERSFEVRGAGSGIGRVYATGAASFGGYFPGVDTFLGLQISAQEVMDDVARRGYCRRMGAGRSIAQWFKWANGRPV
ncbi:hypothetical protein KIPE111705_31365 [Kibdelosporangium persicum]|uniref:FHA domain-containing protein n=1 Tax=Kibdelosporangium persicum TaxID=2698649 RepID=A0ABX2EVJ0_9PSEU|nr:FHA domain-containing protein [Kibdelosporangium persicum]